MIYIKEDLKFKELKIDNNSDIWEVCGHFYRTHTLRKKKSEIFTDHLAASTPTISNSLMNSLISLMYWPNKNVMLL